MTNASEQTGIAVVVPLHNGAAFIERTLDSLQAQTHAVPEVIVVDDGSTDDGAARARRHPLGPRIIEQQNAGVAAARNRGALAASQPFLAFLDQDDLWLPWRHERLAAFLASKPDCRALATTERGFFYDSDRSELEAAGDHLHEGAVAVQSETTWQEQLAAPAPGTVPAVTRLVGTADLLAATIAVSTSYVFERELFFASGGFVSLARSIDDYLTLLNISRLTSIPQLDEPSVLYRIHPSSTAMTTDWATPLLASHVLVRFGGNLIPPGHARDIEHVGPLGLFARHWLLELARSHRLLDALALARLLCTSRREWVGVSWALTKAAVHARLG
ncbi:MAG: glycosyltransferase family A protein [Solirubrobacteraceae bacterium]|jgi:glycosyltransferase involved in cell wall biosynthesis